MFFCDTLEKVSGKKIWELFDFFSGTSIGGIISLLFSEKLYSAGDLLLKFLGQLKNKIFPSKRFFSFVFLGKPLYDPTIIDEVLKEMFGDIKFSEAKGNFLINGSELNEKDEHTTPFAFCSYKDKKEAYSVEGSVKEQDFFKFVHRDIIPKDFLLRDIAKITSAAYPYFSIFEGIPKFKFMDGGFSYNNPGYLTLKYLEEVRNFKLEDIFMLSLGTANDVPQIKLSVDFLNESLFKMRPVFTSNLSIFSNMQDTVNYSALLLCDAMLRERHVRVSPFSSEEINLDQVDRQTLIKIKRTARKMISKSRKFNSFMNTQMGIQESDEVEAYLKKSKYYYFPRYLTYKQYYKSIEDEIQSFIKENDVKQVEKDKENKFNYNNELNHVYSILESFHFPDDVKLNQPIVKLNEGGFFSSFKCDRKEKMNIISLALCVGYLPAIHKYKKEIDVFNHKEGDHWTIFHYAAANEEVAGLLILLEDEFLKENSLLKFSNCYTFELKPKLELEKLKKLIDAFLTHEGIVYSEMEAYNHNTPLNLAKEHESDEVICLFRKLKKTYEERSKLEKPESV